MKAAAALLLSLVPTVALGESIEPPVALNLEGVPSPARERLQEKAKEGATAVIRYVNRTRHLHQLRAEEVIKRAPIAAAALLPETTKVADKEAGSK